MVIVHTRGIQPASSSGQCGTHVVMVSIGVPLSIPFQTSVMDARGVFIVCGAERDVFIFSAANGEVLLYRARHVGDRDTHAHFPAGKEFPG